MSYSHAKRKLILILVLCFFLTSCDINDSNIKKSVENIKKSNVIKIDDLPKLKDYPQISYESEKLSDPFEATFGQEIIARKKLQARAASQRPDHDRSREYLENYPLDSLIMVGTLQKRGICWALIVDKNGVIHRVKEGNYLGQNSGKIIKISEKKIEINELVPDAENGWVNRIATLTIKN